ncbi:MAG: substrate-binding domain-containing protein [Eubacterium sp.]|nr:substrate-binding domain-containing protein [Eubacterium sp.]
MAVTLQQIAQAAGVSRGTVDRALNHRGRIDPQVAEKIKQIAKEAGYQPNRAGRALAMSKKSVKIGVLVQAAGTPFMKEVMKGILDAKEEVERLGAEVLLYTIDELDAVKAVEALQEMKTAGCGAVALVPMDDRRLRETINAFSEEQIPVITFNSDVADSKRLCFVGQNTFQSGRVAAGLMAEILPACAKVLIISGHPSSDGHKNRTRGFTKELKQIRPDVRMLDIQYAFDDDGMAELITGGMIKEYPDLEGIYLAASGVQGVCRALCKAGFADRVRVISNDLTKQNLQCLAEGNIRFLIGQNGYRQGYEPVSLLFHKLLDGKNPREEFLYTELVIKTKYNI